MRKSYGLVKQINTVQELREFIGAMPGDMRIDLDFDDPVEICVMENTETGERTLSLQEA